VLVLVLVPALAELAQGLVLVALVSVAQEQEQVALEWEPVSCRGRKTSIQKSASSGSLL
jgi:hypothetical protein